MWWWVIGAVIAIAALMWRIFSSRENFEVEQLTADVSLDPKTNEYEFRNYVLKFSGVSNVRMIQRNDKAVMDITAGGEVDKQKLEEYLEQFPGVYSATVEKESL